MTRPCEWASNGRAATDPRVVSTVKVLQKKLSNNGFLHRYRPEASEFHQPEGVFIICTLWLVNVLAQMGRLEEAEALFRTFPQALTHLSVINAAFNLEGRPSGKSRRSAQVAGGSR